MRAVIFISCKAPVDPVKLVLKYVEDVESTGVTRTRRVTNSPPPPPPLAVTNRLFRPGTLII